MVIYDQTKTMDDLYKGKLYLNVFDIDYLFSMYQEDYLSSIISADLIKSLKAELETKKTDSPLSPSYFQTFSFYIQNANDEELLHLLAKEIKKGNLFTRSDLKKMKEQELTDTLEDFDLSLQGLKNLTILELYRVRSFKMLLYMMERIKTMNREVIDPTNHIYKGSIRQTKKKIEEFVEEIGFSSSIIESSYFTQISKDIEFCLLFKEQC